MWCGGEADGGAPKSVTVVRWRWNLDIVYVAVFFSVYSKQPFLVPTILAWCS